MPWRSWSPCLRRRPLPDPHPVPSGRDLPGRVLPGGEVRGGTPQGAEALLPGRLDRVEGGPELLGAGVGPRLPGAASGTEDPPGLAPARRLPRRPLLASRVTRVISAAEVLRPK